MLNLYVMNQSLQKIGVVDSLKSLIWAKRYVEFGDCEVYVPATPENLAIFEIGNYLIREDDDMICRIDSIELDTDADAGDFLIIIGTDCKAILNQRVVWRQTSFVGQAGAFVRRIITDNLITPIGETATVRNNRKISNFTLGTFSGFTDTVDIQASYAPVGDKIAEICRRFGYGSKVTFNGTNFIFDLYRGVDRSYNQAVNSFVVFSRDFDNLKSTKYVIDKRNFASIALIGGVGEGNERHLTTVQANTQTGINRYETFVDARNTSNQLMYDDLIAAYPGGSISTVGGVVYYVVAGEYIATLNDAANPANAILTDAPYYEMLEEAGEETLSNMKQLTTFEGEVEASISYVYKTDYYLGDIVQVKNDYGIERAARIVEVVESFNDEGYSLIPTFEYYEES